MKHLMDGYNTFRNNVWPEYQDLYRNLISRGQSPSTMIIACSDSRVDPQLIFNAGPGDLFVVRNVANLVPPYAPDSEYHGTSAALEFAVKALKVPHIVVMGHAQCGGVHTLLNGAPAHVADFVEPWMSIAKPARDKVCECSASGEERQRMGELETIQVSLANLLTFPWIKSAVDGGSLSIVGCYFDIATGELLWQSARALSAKAA